jgi:hypothetical protein
LSLSEHFMPIIPRHIRLLERLHDQLKADQYGGIGWRGLMDENEPFTIDQLFKPLMERGMVEDLSKTDLGKAGVYFVRITPLGLKCLHLGVMLKEQRVTTEQEIAKYITAPPQEVVATFTGSSLAEIADKIKAAEVSQ